MEERVLIVDDDHNLLSSLRRQLVDDFNLTTALGGMEAIDAVQSAQDMRMPFAVVICDMQMPEMNGIQTLRRIHDIAPETVLLMLTGNSDQQTAVNAINEGNVHRFYTKPCSIEVLTDGIKAAIEQYRLTTAERDLLERTLAGSVKVLVDLISINDAVVAGMARRLRDYVRRVTGDGKFPRRWQLEIASSLAMIGQVAIPPEVVAKKRAGGELSEAEQLYFTRAPEAARDLIVNIPRLAKVAEAVYLQDRCYDGSGFPENGPKGEDIPTDARMLKILKDLAEAAEETGGVIAEAFARLEKRPNRYDPKMFSKIRECIEETAGSEASPQYATPLPSDQVNPTSDPGTESQGEPENKQDRAVPQARPVAAAVPLSSSKRAAPSFKQQMPRRHPRKMYGVLMIAGVPAVIGAMVWAAFDLASTENMMAELASEKSRKLVEQIESAAKGWVAPANAVGGTIKVNNGTVEVGGVPRSVCIQAGWQLARTGILTINGNTEQRLSGSVIAKQCLILGDNIMSWSPYVEK